MMFFILARSDDEGVSWEDDFQQKWENGADAQHGCRTLNDSMKRYGNPTRFRVRRVVDTDDDNFYAREAAKGFTPVTKEGIPNWCYWPDWRLPHIDPDNSRHIRCFRNIADAVTCRYTSMRMPKFFTELCDLEEGNFAEKLVQLGYYNDTNREFKILRDPDEIENAYVNGPRSCMNDPEDYEVGEIHPSRCYASPDLGLAVIMIGEECVARCVCWPDKKIYGPIYGHAALLKEELKKIGFRRPRGYSAWRGARLLKIWDKNVEAFVCPYLDIGKQVSVARDGKHLRIHPKGAYGATNCDGYVEMPCNYPSW